MSEVNFDSIITTELARLEAEFYTAKTFDMKNYFIGEDIIDFVQYGTSKELNEEKVGFPILRLNEFDSAFISEPAKYCSLVDSEMFNSLKLFKNDVLICRTNGNPKYVGKSALVPQNYEYAYASYLFKIRPKKEMINSSTLVAFLNSKYGRIEIEKYSIASNQVNFSPAKFRQLRIPAFSEDLNNFIEELTYQAFEKLEKSKTTYTAAENILLSEIGLTNFTPSNEPVNIKTFSESFTTSGRLDAEYYSPKYEDIEKALTGCVGGYCQIKDAFTQNKSTFKIEEKETYQYVEIGSVNVSTGEITPLELLGSDLPPNAKRILRKGDVILSKVRTYRGAAAIIDKDGYVGSSAFTVLRENGKVNKETLLVFLKSKILREYSLKPNTGTSYPVIVDEDVLSFPLPLIPLAKQSEIAALITQSFSLKKQSEHLLEVAKRAVEIAIEQDEAAAMGWIVEQTGEQTKAMIA